MTERIVTTDISEIPPEPPPRGAGHWIRENLFPSVGSSILTVLAAGIVIFGVKEGLERWIEVLMPLLLVLRQPDHGPQRVFHRMGNQGSFPLKDKWIFISILCVKERNSRMLKNDLILD